MAVDFRDMLLSKPQSPSCLCVLETKLLRFCNALPKRENKLKVPLMLSDWHRDTAPLQFTLLISERSKGVRVKWELLQCWVQQQTILQKSECSDNFSVNLLLSHIFKNLDYCNPFSFPLLFSDLLPSHAVLIQVFWT